MAPKLQIAAHVLKRLAKVKTHSSGCLFGVWYRGTLLILGFNLESKPTATSSSSSSADSVDGRRSSLSTCQSRETDSNAATSKFNYKRLQNGFPAELDLCGLVKFGLCTDAEAHLTEVLQDVDVTDNPIVLHCELGTVVGLRAMLLKHGQLEETEFEVVDEQRLWNEFAYTRLSCRLDVNCAEGEESFKKALQDLRMDLASGRTGFNIKNTDIHLMGGSKTGTTISGCKTNARISDLLAVARQTSDAAAAAAAAAGKLNGDGDKDDGFGVPANLLPQKTKKKAAAAAAAVAATVAERSDYETLSVKLLLKISSEQAAPVPALAPTDATQAAAVSGDATESNDSVNGCAFHLDFHEDDTQLSVPLLVTSMALLHRDTDALALYDILIEGLCRSIRQIEYTAVEQHYVRRCEDANVGAPQTYVFMPDGLGHFFSCVYFSQAADSDAMAVQHRQRLHEAFGLPLQRPHFRKTNRYRCGGDERAAAADDAKATATGKLVSPHAMLMDANRVAGGRQSLVSGRYTYYHYMQDGFNDNGWGCAYRSLQTLCSWFRWQGYSEAEVPDHRAIQQYLVRIGDKPHTFAGSKQWIGSMEVSMCMDGFMGVQCRIVRVDSGAEMGMYGAQLARHFETHGTPVMIGGGVLAHTILGVEVGDGADEVRFLILDPHYTGADEVGVVLKKGWCGWKGVGFWDKKSYYNMCMPQLPQAACF